MTKAGEHSAFPPAFFGTLLDAGGAKPDIKAKQSVIIAGSKE